MLGIQAASMGFRSPTWAKLRLRITKMMNTKASTKPSAICPPGLNVKLGRRNQVDFDIVNWRPDSKLEIMVQDKMYVLGRPRDI